MYVRGGNVKILGGGVRTLIVCILAFAVAFTGIRVEAFAEGTVVQTYWDGEVKIASATPVTAGTNTIGDGNSNPTWYVVQRGKVEINTRITVTGNVHLILADGAELQAKKGIQVSQDNSLTIYGQTQAVTENTGKIVANGIIYGDAGIGGNSSENSGIITIKGGTVTANSDKGAGIGGGFGGSGTVTIEGGEVTATSTEGAGIGGGVGGSGTVKIKGGAVIATSTEGAGIGGGITERGTVTIEGGKVTAISTGGAGIGGGGGGTGIRIGTVTIKGGTVTANSNFGAGIGGGFGRTGTVTITGGTVTANSNDGAGIGGGASANSGDTFSTEPDGKAIIEANSISDTTGKGNWKGIIFEGNNGSVYGNQELSADFEIKSGKTLTVPVGTTLTIPLGKTLTVKGKLVKNGTLENNGKIKVFGTIEGEGNINRNAPLEKPFEVEFTPPTPKPNLTYIGAEQELISAGTVEANIGKLQYSLSKNEGYSEAIPKATNAGRYTVHYKVVGDDNDYDYNRANGSVDVSIAKAEITPAVTIGGWTYNTTPNAPAVTGNTGNGAITYEYFTDENCTNKTTADNSGADNDGGMPKKAGRYRVKATIDETTNYKEAAVKATFEISKANQEAFSITNVLGKQYGNEDFELEASGGSGKGAVTYSVPAGNGVLEINGNRAKIVGAGNVTITGEKAADRNYNETSASVGITIAKKNLTVKADNKTVKKGDAMPAFTCTADGLINGDTFESPTFRTETDNTNTVGEYDIEVSGGILKKMNGKNATKDYEITYQKGKLVVNEIYKVTVTDGTGSGNYSEGDTVNIKANEKSGYTFTKWTSEDGVVFANASAKETSFVMLAKEVTVKANYRANSSGTSGGSGSGTSGSASGGTGGGTSSGGAYLPEVVLPESGTAGGDSSSGSANGKNTGTNENNKSETDSGVAVSDIDKSSSSPVKAKIKILATKGKNKTAVAKISFKMAEEAINKAKEEAKANGKKTEQISLEVKIDMPKGTDKVKVTLTEGALGKIISEEVNSLTIDSRISKTVFGKTAIAEIKKKSKGSITLNTAPNKKLSKKAKKLIRNRPVYDISLSYAKGKKKVTTLGKGSIKASIPYNLKKNEKADGLYAFYIDRKGKVRKIKGSYYDEESGAMVFSTERLAVFGIGYTEK